MLAYAATEYQQTALNWDKRGQSRNPLKNQQRRKTTKQSNKQQQLLFCICLRGYLRTRQHSSMRLYSINQPNNTDTQYLLSRHFCKESNFPVITVKHISTFSVQASCQYKLVKTSTSPKNPYCHLSKTLASQLRKIIVTIIIAIST